jgi:hypothetical protein
MSGFYADIADVDKSVYSSEAAGYAYERSVERIKSETSEFRKYTIEPETLRKDNGPGSAFSSRTTAGHSSMFPVWFMSYRNGDRVTYATVNGQTGKVAADLPIDVKKYLMFSGVLAVIIFIILNLFLVLTPKAVMITASVLTVSVFAINATQRLAIRKAVTGEGDKGLDFVAGRLKGAVKGNKEKSDAKASDKTEVPEATMDGTEALTMVVGVISVLAALAMIFFIHVVHDMPYYVVCIIDAVVFILSFRYTLKNYNLMATRRLPQFDRKGGDDRA